MDDMTSSALFSPCRKFRYALLRRWQPTGTLAMFIGVNPSTADEKTNDPTVTRCINYAKAWGHGGMFMANLFAIRGTDPACLYQPGITRAGLLGERLGDGWKIDDHLLMMAKLSAIVVCAWGNHGQVLHRGDEVKALLSKYRHALYCLKLNQGDIPGHPLYLRADLQPQLWQARRPPNEVLEDQGPATTHDSDGRTVPDDRGGSGAKKGAKARTHPSGGRGGKRPPVSRVPRKARR